MIIPDISQVNSTSFVVTAPAGLPSGTTLQLQKKVDGESEWVNVGPPVGAGGIVPVVELDSCTGYWVRWKQNGSLSSQ